MEEHDRTISGTSWDKNTEYAVMAIYYIVISTYNPMYRMYNPIEITSYNW